MALQIKIRELTGNLITLDVETTDTIDNVKTKIMEDTDIPIFLQRLVFENKELKNGKLSDYDIKNGTILAITLKLRGGGKVLILS
jgi:ubiquitin